MPAGRDWQTEADIGVSPARRGREKLQKAVDMATSAVTLAAIQSRFPEVSSSEFRGQTRLRFSVAQMAEALSFLRHQLAFDMLVDITCVDYLNYRNAEHRFGLVYLLCNTETAERLTVRVYLDEDRLTVPSLVPLWEGANWMEREVWDMFGIRFAGHPDFAEF